MSAPLELHPEIEGKRYTLRGIFRERAAAEKKLTKLAKDGLDSIIFEGTGPKGSKLHFVAARHELPPQYRAGMPHEKTPDWVATAYAVRVFRMVVQASKKADRPLRWYKRLDVEALRKTIARYRWTGRRLDVAGSIVSSTILTHPFPNANHRTSMSLARVYLEFVGVDWPGYSLRGRGQKRLHTATHEFFRESKYLLQVLRHPDLVRIAHEEGYTHLHIGPNTEAEIVAGDLELTSDEIRERHEALSRRMVRDVAAEPLRKDLQDENKVKLKDWVAWLKKSK